MKGWNPDAITAFSTVPLFWNKAGGLPCPSGYCPPLADVRRLAQRLGERFPHCLLVVDEAYMDFAAR